MRCPLTMHYWKRHLMWLQVALCQQGRGAVHVGKQGTGSHLGMPDTQHRCLYNGLLPEAAAQNACQRSVNISSSLPSIAVNWRHSFAVQSVTPL